MKPSAVMLVFVAACGSSGPAKQQPNANEHRAESAGPGAPFRLVLGEATIIELLDKHLQPISRPMWKLRTDGTTEHASRSGQWRPVFSHASDGTVSLEGNTVATISHRAITFVEYEGQTQPPIAIDGNTLTVMIDESMFVKVELDSDGGITVHHARPRVQWRIEAADPAVMRTAFLAFGATIASRVN